VKQTLPHILFKAVSENSKTGPIPTTYSESKTCPKSCPFLKQGCYSRYGPSFWHWRRLDQGTATGRITWAKFLNKIRHLNRGQIWRHNVAGDLPGDQSKIDGKALADLTSANAGKAGFTFTHHDVLSKQNGAHNRAAIRKASAAGFTINLSGNNLQHADKLVATGVAPVVTIVPTGSPNTQFTPNGHKVIICPAQTRENVTCNSCRLCAKADRSMKCNGGKQLIIGFLPHGMGAKYAERVASRGTVAA
jgi:hypothetical protein